MLEGKAIVEDANGDEHTLDAGHGWFTVTDTEGNITESQATGAADFEFSGIDVNSLRGADDTPMILNMTVEDAIDDGSNVSSNGTDDTGILDLTDIPVNEANLYTIRLTLIKMVYFQLRKEALKRCSHVLLR